MSAIVVVPLGDVDEDSIEAIDTALWRAFGFEVRRLPAAGEPFQAYDGQRHQYNSVLILRDIIRRVPQDVVRLLAVTERDMFIPMLSFVFGQAQMDGRVAVVSLARLRQEFHGLPPNAILLCSRAVKEAVHEIGHTFGLIHCPDQECPMSLSNTVLQVDRKREEFCGSCLIALENSVRSVRSQEERLRRSMSN